MLSITNTTGSRRTPAKFIDSCAVPLADEPSPIQPSATRGSPRTRNASAAPTATGRIDGRCDGPATMPTPGVTSCVRRFESRPFVVPPIAAHVLAEHAPRLDAAVEVQAEIAVQRRGEVVRRHRGGDADRRGLVPLAGVERARQLALLEEHVPALVEPPREQQRVQDPHERLAVEAELRGLVQSTARLSGAHARNRHAASVATPWRRPGAAASGRPGMRPAPVPAPLHRRCRVN